MQLHQQQRPQQARPLPNAAILQSMSVDELMDTTLRLSDILAQESVMMDTMQLKDLPRLNEEKMKLTAVLEVYQQVMASDPSFVKKADEKTREQLVLLTDDLAFNVEENFRKVSVARAVNSRVMQAIMDVMSEQHRPGTYGRKGQASQNHDFTLSMNLNERA
jgi:flagellar biosynthesis/type III secretory pathway chaperone